MSLSDLIDESKLDAFLESAMCEHLKWALHLSDSHESPITFRVYVQGIIDPDDEIGSLEFTLDDLLDEEITDRSVDDYKGLLHEIDEFRKKVVRMIENRKLEELA